MDTDDSTLAHADDDAEPQARRGWRHRPRRTTAVIAGTALLSASVAGGVWLPRAFASSSSSGVPASSSLSAGTTIDAASVASSVDTSVVDITAVDRYTGEEDAGTGMILTSTGEILTNNHVVKDATSLRVRVIATDKTYRAVVVGTDATEDVAVIKLVGASGLTPITVGDSNEVTTGIAVAAIGNAGDKPGKPSVATGTITELNRTITASDEGASTSERLHGLFVTNADVEAGDSGGPLVDSSGQVIGMDTAASVSGSTMTQSGTDTTISTEGFAIPIAHALAIAEKIEAGDASSTIVIGTPGFLGVEVSTASTQSSDSSGEVGGGSYGGYGFGSGEAGGYGSSGGYSSSGGYGSSGAISGESTSDTTTSGATVAGVLSGSPAARAGIVAGDVITALGGHTVTSATSLSALLDATHGGSSVSVTWTDSSGDSHTATITLVAGPAA